MMDFIDRLRSKPKVVRTQIALITSAVITLAIFGVWATVLNFNLSQPSSGSVAAVGSVKKDDVGPLASFGEVFSKGWSGLMDSIGQIKGGTKGVQDLVQSIGQVASTSATSTTQTTPEPTPVKQQSSGSDVFIIQ